MGDAMQDVIQFMTYVMAMAIVIALVAVSVKTLVRATASRRTGNDVLRGMRL